MTMPRKSKNNPQQPDPTTFKIEIEGKPIAMVPGIGETRRFVKCLIVPYKTYAESRTEGWREVKV